jgi:hypothetical protein
MQQLLIEDVVAIIVLEDVGVMLVLIVMVEAEVTVELTFVVEVVEEDM